MKMTRLSAVAQVTLEHLETAATVRCPAGCPVARLLLGQLQPRGAPEAFRAREAASTVAEEGALGATTPELGGNAGKFRFSMVFWWEHPCFLFYFIGTS